MKLLFCKLPACSAFALLLISMITFNAGASDNTVQIPESIPGFVLIDSPYAFIYARMKPDPAVIKSLFNDVSDDFKTMTGAEPEKGTIIVIGTSGTHPFITMTDNRNGAQPEIHDEMDALMEKLSGKGIKLEDALRLAPISLPYDSLALLNPEGRKDIRSEKDNSPILTDAAGDDILQK